MSKSPKWPNLYRTGTGDGIVDTPKVEMDFKKALADAAKHGSAEQAEFITLNAYIDRVAERPTIAATAHQRVYDMIKAAGFTDGLHAGEVSYNFFCRDHNPNGLPSGP